MSFVSEKVTKIRQVPILHSSQHQKCQDLISVCPGDDPDYY